MNKKYTETELNDLISQIETQFHSHLEKAEATEGTVELAKSEAAPLAKVEAKEEKKDDDKKEAKKDDEKKDDKKDGDEPEFMKSEYSDADKAELKKLYSDMSKSEQETHFHALKSIMATEVAQPAPAETAKPVETPMAKTEENGGEKLAKAESEIEALKKSNEELKAGMAELVAAMKSKVVKPSAPKGKAVTQLAALEKSEKQAAPSMTREEAKKILGKKAQNPSLEKAERELINAFCFNQVGLEKVQHLLT
jgi:hypothetical protein